MSIWIAKELEQRGWSHRELARRAGVSQTAVSQAVSMGRGIGWDFCAAIAKPLGVSPEHVFRLAGLLPSLPASEDGPILEEIIEIVKHLPNEEKEEVRDYAKLRYEKLEKKKPPKTIAVTVPKQVPIIERISSVPENIPPETVAKVRALVERLSPAERANLIEHLLSRRDFVEALKLRGVEVQSRPLEKNQVANIHKGPE